MESRQIADLPYDQRQMIIVRDPEAIKRAERQRKVSTVARAAFGGLGIAGLATAAIINELDKRSGANAQLLAVTKEEAGNLEFPVGHPRAKVVYVGHPVVPSKYIPAAQFHTFLFQHKVAEALRLIRSLGAETIDVLRLEGWDRSVGIAVAAPVPGAAQAQVGAGFSGLQASGRSLQSSMRLTPVGSPTLPADLVWYPHEPLWQEVVDARLNSGLTSFALDVASYDDYGINSELKALIGKSGLEVGGSFTEHRATLWRLEGKFR